MTRPHYTRLARQDLDEILAYIASENESAAANLLDALYRTCARLAEYPRLGTRCFDLGRRLRHFTVRNYVIFYRPNRVHGAVIIRVLHGGRDADAIFKRRN